ncbi:hypothetical protein EDD11_003763 [Mortierella claussenii]|nr:hypothetical protein EDD11_003763 [Mortierella claussenii]
MEFTFTANVAPTPASTPATAPPTVAPSMQEANTFGFTSMTQPHDSHQGSIAFLAPTSAAAVASIAITAGGVNSEYDRVSLKKERGVGNTTQWRKRLIHQIEDRIKGKRISIHNARRPGLQQQQQQVQQNQQQQQLLQSTSASPYNNQGAMLGQIPVSGQYQRADVILSAVNSGTVAEDSNNQDVNEVEERRLVAEVWDSYKNENSDALQEVFQGLTDQEIEEIEQDILQYCYPTEYDPTYDMLVDMEMQDMDQTIEHYMRLETSYTSTSGEDEETAAISLSITLLSGSACVRCQQGPLVFEPLVSTVSNSSQPRSGSGGVRARCAAACGFSLEKDALLNIASSARSHR